MEIAAISKSGLLPIDETKIRKKNRKKMGGREQGGRGEGREGKK